MLGFSVLAWIANIVVLSVTSATVCCSKKPPKNQMVRDLHEQSKDETLICNLIDSPISWCQTPIRMWELTGCGTKATSSLQLNQLCQLCSLNSFSNSSNLFSSSIFNNSFINSTIFHNNSFINSSIFRNSYLSNSFLSSSFPSSSFPSNRFLSSSRELNRRIKRNKNRCLLQSLRNIKLFTSILQC